MAKKPLDIDIVMARIEEAMKPYPQAAMFDLARASYRSPFEQLVGCIISIRTKDEVTLPTTLRLLEQARAPEDMAELAPEAIGVIIHGSSFHKRKAAQIHAIATRIVREYSGELPCDRDILLSFPGVGIKCANLTLGIACGQLYISVDVHVHRVTNRWGYVKTSTPQAATAALEAKLPKRYWLDLNRLLVPFGKHICTSQLPHCSTCPVLDMCQQVGAQKHR